MTVRVDAIGAVFSMNYQWGTFAVNAPNMTRRQWRVVLDYLSGLERDFLPDKMHPNDLGLPTAQQQLAADFESPPREADPQ